MADQSDLTIIMEEKEELMIPSKGGDPILRTAHFLLPSITSIHEATFRLPLNSLSSVSNSKSSKEWPLKVSFNGWRNPQKDWKTWVDGMHFLYQSVWKKAGIHEAVLNSTYTIQRNEDLIFGFAERWCSGTNTFIFPWGEATITLEDMMILGGYSVLGKSVFCPLENKELEKIEEKLLEARLHGSRTIAHKASHSWWMDKFMNNGSKIEHEAFLSLWLSRFVFPAPGYDTILKNVFPIAINLARGTKFALAPAVLAILYRDLRLLKDAMIGSNKMGTSNCEENDVSELKLWAPLKLVEVWALERFQSLQPKTRLCEYGKPRVSQWQSIEKNTIDNVRLAIESGNFCWRPYAIDMETQNNPSLQFYKEKEEWVSVENGLDEEFEAVARCLRVSELVGLDCIEQYLPHRVSMQFGMDQDIPGHVDRINASPEIAWKNYTREIVDEKLFVPSRFFESEVTARYLEWWNKSMLGVEDRTRAVDKKKSSSKRIERKKFPNCSIEKKADNDALVPPGFRPKLNRAEVKYDEDKLSQAEHLGNAWTDKPSMKAPLQSPLSSTMDNETIQKIHSIVKPVENIAKSEPEKEEPEKSREDSTGSRAGPNVPSMVGANNGQNSTFKAKGRDLENAADRLEAEIFCPDNGIFSSEAGANESNTENYISNRVGINCEKIEYSSNESEFVELEARISKLENVVADILKEVLSDSE